jgi:MFS family permease
MVAAVRLVCNKRATCLPTSFDHRPQMFSRLDRLGVNKRREFAEHWKVVLAGFFGVMTGVWSFPVFMLGPLVKPFEADFGWKRTAIVACSSFMAAGLVIGVPFAGWLVDRIGVRVVAMTSMTLLGACLSAIPFAGGDIRHLYGIYFFMGLLCAGSGGVTFTRAIGSWFVVGRGFALGIALAGTGAASFVAPILIGFVIPVAGWHWACGAVAALTLFVGIPIVFIGLKEPMRKRPGPTPGQDSAEDCPGMTQREALGDPRFWILAATIALLGLFVASLLIHTLPMLIDMGLTWKRAAAIASVNGIAMIGGRLITGPLLDRFPARYVGAGIFLLAASGAMLFVVLGTSAALFMVAAIGSLIGAELDLMSYMALQYFGLRSYGAIFGLLIAIYSAAGMVTPFVSGGLIAWGGYSALFLGAAASFATASLLMILGFRTSRRAQFDR